jgi:hypothetical protein
MQFQKLFTLLILGIACGCALPTEDKIEAIAMSTLPAQVSARTLRLQNAQRGGGWYYAWNSTTSFSAWSSLSDMGCDGFHKSPSLIRSSSILHLPFLPHFPSLCLPTDFHENGADALDSLYIEAEAYLVRDGSPYVLRCNNLMVVGTPSLVIRGHIRIRVLSERFRHKLVLIYRPGAMPVDIVTHLQIHNMGEEQRCGLRKMRLRKGSGLLLYA